jgi:hypothetical protein
MLWGTGVAAGRDDEEAMCTDFSRLVGSTLPRLGG